MPVTLTFACAHCGEVVTRGIRGKRDQPVNPDRCCSTTCAQRYRAAHRPQRATVATTEQVAEMRRLRDEGIRPVEIAKRLGLRVEVVRKRTADLAVQAQRRSALRVWCPSCRSFGIPAAATRCECGARRSPGYEPVRA